MCFFAVPRILLLCLFAFGSFYCVFIVSLCLCHVDVNILTYLLTHLCTTIIVITMIIDVGLHHGWSVGLSFHPTQFIDLTHNATELDPNLT